MKQGLELSIIIPAYNVEQYIKVSVESIFQQGLDETTFEVIIVNDGSTDGTPNIINSLATKYNNIRVLNQANGGLSVSRNNGLQMAKGEYVIFIDSDDMYLPNSLSKVLECAIYHKADFVKGQLVKLTDRQIEEEENLAKYSTCNVDIKSLTVVGGQQAFVDYYDPDASYVVLNMLRRSFLVDNNMRFIEGITFEDVAFTVEAYLQAQRVVYMPLCFYVYRQREGSIMSTMKVKKLLDMNLVIAHNLLLDTRFKLTKSAKAKLNFAAFRSSSIVVWYLCNYRCLYPHSREVVADLKSKIGKLHFCDDKKQRLFSFCINYIPYIYIGIRYLMARHKY